MSELPAGWVETTLGEVVDYGKTEKVEPKSIPANAWILELEDIEKDTSRLLQRLTIEQRESKSTKNAFQKGDVLYGKLRPYLNKVIVADDDGFCTTEIIPIKSNTAIDGRYLFYWLKTPKFLSYVNSVSYGLNMPRLGTKDGLAAPLVLPPLSEQKRIADKLDTLLARVDSCERHLERVPQILKRFRQSVLAAATSGRLTEEWREEKGLSITDWDTKTGKEIFPFITSGSRWWAKYYSESGSIFIRVGNLDHDTIELDLSNIQYVTPPDDAESKRTRVQIGDILISITADVGMVGYVQKDIGDAYTNQHVCIARQTGEYVGEFLAYYLASPVGGLGQLTKAQRGATKAGLTLGDIRELNIQIPSPEEQAEIVRRVETLFAFADRLETRYETGHGLVEQFTPSLLAKAFRGELVKQDPNDESAEELVKRIRATRDAQKASSGGKSKKSKRN